MLIYCAFQMKMCLFAHQKVVRRQVLILSQYSMKMTTKLWVYLFVPITQRMHNLQFVWVKIRSLCRMYRTLLQDTPHAWSSLRADRLRLRPTDANTGVCELRTADQMVFYTSQGLLHSTALPIDKLHVEMWLHVDSFHGKVRTNSL
jgi:hypothetical protein